jgi:hypothetical protein
MRPLNGPLTSSDAAIEHLAVQDPRVPRLRSVPSILPVTAAAFLAAVQRLDCQASLDGREQCFPLQALGVEASVRAFYDLSGI